MMQFIDVTDAINYDESKEENTVLQTVNAFVSHELRNPLNSILAQILCDKTLLAEVLEIVTDEAFQKKFKKRERPLLRRLIKYLRQIEASIETQESSANLMVFMVHDFLDLAQIKNGKFRKNVGLVNIRDIVQKVMSIQMSKARNRGIKLMADFVNICDQIADEQDSDGSEIKFSPFVMTDGHRITQLLLNLQSNALKFTKEGQVVIRVEIEHNEDTDEKFLKVAVQDTGVGIPEQDQKKLFKLFGFINNKNSVMNTNGIGLGLVIVKNIVTQFEGEIECKSIAEPHPDHGTSFEFYIKLGIEHEIEEGEERFETEAICEDDFIVNSTKLVFKWEYADSNNNLLQLEPA